MPKQGIVFALFLFLVAIVGFQARNLPLSFFVLFPSLLYPVFYFYDHKQRGWFFRSAVVILVAAWLLFGLQIGGVEVFVLCGLMGVYFLLFVFFRKSWCLQLAGIMQKEKNARDELHDLRQKHQTRLTSLQHLEMQVSSLLDLFEIARDFSECLSVSGIADLLYQKVMPELPFHSLKIIQIFNPTDEEPEGFMSTFSITSNGVSKVDGQIDADVQSDVIQTLQNKKMLDKGRDGWIFPLTEDEQVRVSIVVGGADEGDLAKFEVLVAYLGLQVKKVKLYETVRDLSIRDELTGVFVRRHFLERFEDEIRRAIKHELPMAVLMLDIDHFKRYNDEHGHLAGDGVLKQVTQLLIENLRKVDIVSRYGGEEFVIVLPESTEDGAFEVAERIRSNIARNSFKVFNDKTRVTISIGIAIFPKDVKNRLPTQDYPGLTFDLIQKADKALYRAKDEGRNRVVQAKDL